jgi:two-component system OmpR family sensor kinase
MTLSHLAVALIMILIVAAFTYATFRSYLLANQEAQLLHRGTQVSRVMQGYFTGQFDEATADYLVGGLESALEARVYVVDALGEVLLAQGRTDLPVARVPLAAEKQVVAAGHTWSGILSSGRGPLVTVGVPIRLPEQIVGGVWLEEPLAPALARAGGLLARELMGGALGVLAALLLALYLARRLSRPLTALNRAAGDVAAGHFESRITPEGPDEVRELARRFNRMAESLQGMIQDLQRETALRDDLLAHVAHDLKTPLTTLRGYLEALQDGLLRGKEAERALEVAHSETLRLQRLVARLLEAARLEASLRERRDVLAMRPWAVDIVARVEPLAQAKAIRLQVSGARTAEIITNGDAATEVLMNLLANAIAWSPDGGEVEVHIAEGDGGVRVTVLDRGPGVPTLLLDHLFEPFVTGDRSRSGKGTGLGLAISRRLVTGMGGRMGAGNRDGGGFQAWFWLPKDPGGRDPEPGT